MGNKRDEGIEVREGEEVAGKTIVGGRPLKRRKVKMNIPAGIEKTIYKASIDKEFRRKLFDDRMGAIHEHGFELTPTEQTMLESIPDNRLALIIDQIRPEKHGKRKFMRAVATAVVTLATGTAVVACDIQTKGATAGIPPDTAVDTSPDIQICDAITPDISDDDYWDVENDPVEDSPDDGEELDADEGDISTDVGFESLGITPDE